MGRHAESAKTTRDPRRIARGAGLLGGLIWVAKYFLPDSGSPTATVLLWCGAVLLTVALIGLGLLLVKAGLPPLRWFVALALPTLVWGVFALVRSPSPHQQFVDALLGGAVGLVSLVQLLRHHPATRATL